MTEPDNNKDQQPQPEPQDTPIIIVTYTKDKQMKIDFKTNNLFLLSHACRLLSLHLDNLIIGMQEPPKIISQGGLQSLRRFLNKK